ncbi:sec-independent protein translocase protein TATB, chloroplastic [Vigna umbellata]|uniref:sec-independent protein translocase protein TATB, chloroplastic n=1 Tax=Vigna umbellata TaxID=87088 RepID=UPI001F5E5E1C|nr:sec-independent protein translocase protein TATB, chloroplastic [Vigna umbellata]
MTQSVAMASSSMLCPSAVSHTKFRAFHLSSMFTPLGRGLFSPWSGLKHLGISAKPKPLLHIARKGCKGMVVYASLFGVGAPEALVIGVVALLVFGPKGLAEVARNLGKTLRAFQPTIRELQDVSREFKTTLEREIGLDDNISPTQNRYNSNASNTRSTSSSTVDPNGTPDPKNAYSSEEYLKITKEQLKASAAQQQEQTPPKEREDEPQIKPPAKETATTVPPPPPQKPESETLPLDS